MEIREEHAGDVLVLGPDGDLSSAEDCHSLEQRLSTALSAGARYLVVDFARVGHLTSPSLRALLLASRKLGRVKGRLVLCGMTVKVQKAFSISGFDRDFTVLPSREAAVRVALEPLAAPAAKAPPRRPAQARPAAGLAGPAQDVPAAAPPAPPPVAADAPRTPAAIPLPPDPRLALAARLLAAFGDVPDALPSPPAETRGGPAGQETLASAILRAFDVVPA